MFLSKINQVILVAKIITKSIGIIWQKVDASLTFCALSEKSLHFHLLSVLNQFFSVTVFRLALFIVYLYIHIIL